MLGMVNGVRCKVPVCFVELWKSVLILSIAVSRRLVAALDLVKNHLMYAVREEVEILKDQIKELVEKNSQLEKENCLLKNLASPEQMEKFQSRLPSDEATEQFTHPSQPCSAGSAV
ncbi:hypothetical protein FKM82_024925 [Ascaphus truei]